MNTQKRRIHQEQYGSPIISEVFGEEYLFKRLPEKLAPVKRVALFAESFFPRYDGVSQHVYNTLRYLQQSGREVLVFAPDDAPHQVGASKVIPLPSFSVRNYPDLRVGLPTAEVSRQLARFKPDLIHVFAPVSCSARAISFGCQQNIPMIANFETNLPQYMACYGIKWLQGTTQRWLRYLHNRCDLTLVPSQSVLQQLQQTGFRHLACWPNGVNEQRFNPVHTSQTWRSRLLDGRSSSSLLCIYVGRLATEKNVSLLLDVARMPGVALTIIGDGPQRNQLECLFRETGTYFAGRLFGNDLACAYASADVFVFPSKTETFGLVTIEAMASGLPVVVSKEGGATDFVTQADTGFLCETPGDFGAAIRQLRDDATLREAMTQRVRVEAENHSYSVVMTRLEDYYRQVMRRRSTEYN